jgi:hypothetical protein
MRLNFSPSLQINNLFQSYQINRSAANKVGSQSKSSDEERRDTFTLSSKGGAMNMINNLMKQKMEITDRKNSLIASTLEKGSSMETIKSQLEAYDEQLENIDVQITQAMAKELEKKEETENDDTPKTREELENERLNDIVTLSGDVGNIDMLDSVKTKVDRRITTLESEISLDNGRMGAADFKKEELSQLKKKSAELASDIGLRMADIAEEIDENNEKSSEEENGETDQTDDI